MLIIVCGLAGSGKTTISSEICSRFGFEHISSDEVRKKYFKKADYSEKGKLEVYMKMKELAESRLLGNKNINLVIDATFSLQKYRDMLVELSQNFGQKIVFILCRSSDENIKKWMSMRRENRFELSDADFDVYLKMKKEFEPISADLEMDLAKNNNLNRKKLIEFIKNQIEISVK